MTTIGLVLSAGGTSGAAHHAGVLAALEEATGWDARSADLLVGTSAGASTAATLRAGLSATDHAAYYNKTPLSAQGQAISDRVTTRLDLPENPPPPTNRRPANPTLLVRGIFGRGRPRPVVSLTGVLHEGTVEGSALAARVSESHPEPWPDAATWICAVNLKSGQRVVFGRDDIPADLGPAVQASSAIPGYFEPAVINGQRYVDGGVHSTTNASLVAGLGFDLVVISSSMTAVAQQSSWPGGPLGRAWHSRTLRREVEAIRASGTPVLVFQPTADDLAVREASNLATHNAAAVCSAARISTLAHLAHPRSATGRMLLENHSS